MDPSAEEAELEAEEEDDETEVQEQSDELDILTVVIDKPSTPAEL